MPPFFHFGRALGPGPEYAPRFHAESLENRRLACLEVSARRDDVVEYVHARELLRIECGMPVDDDMASYIRDGTRATVMRLHELVVYIKDRARLYELDLIGNAAAYPVNPVVELAR